jgi:hypothetical protein
VQQALAKNEISKIFVGGQKNTVCLSASIKHGLIVDPRGVLRDKQDIVSIRPKPVDNFLVDVLVRHDRHARTYSIG